ncbi:hypothetical protein B0H12DRAFT_50086 [Mycena haematopus]|nr:hypothetical protein B0H12DRAFT_50086 [Mycena haematopus]
MAIQHFTLAKFRSATTTQQKEDAYTTVYMLLSAALEIPGIKGFKVGPPINKRGTRGYEFAVTVEFQDLKAFNDWIPHAHHQLVSDFINGFSDGLSFQVSADATLNFDSSFRHAFVVSNRHHSNCKIVDTLIILEISRSPSQF